MAQFGASTNSEVPRTKNRHDVTTRSYFRSNTSG